MPTPSEPVTPIWIRIWTVWAIALALLLLFFIVVEGIGLVRDGYGDTLTETVVYLREKNSWLYHLIIDVCFLMAVTMAWVIYHFRFWVRVVSNG